MEISLAPIEATEVEYITKIFRYFCTKIINHKVDIAKKYSSPMQIDLFKKLHL